MKKKIASALSGLALLASSACARVDYKKVETIVSNKISEINEQCEDKKYDNDFKCAKDDIKEAYNSVYSIVAATFPNKPDESPDVNEGSGLLLKGGYLLTAYHIIDIPIKKNSVTRYYINVNDKYYSLEKVVGDKETDFMIMKLSEPMPNQKPYEYAIGNSKQLEIGNALYLVGNAYGFGVNAREGIVSQIGFNPANNSFDEDFAISCGGNQGDSGGPVFAIMDGNVELVGIMVSVVSEANKLAYARSLETILKKLEKIAPKIDLPLKRQ